MGGGTASPVRWRFFVGGVCAHRQGGGARCCDAAVPAPAFVSVQVNDPARRAVPRVLSPCVDLSAVVASLQCAHASLSVRFLWLSVSLSLCLSLSVSVSLSLCLCLSLSVSLSLSLSLSRCLPAAPVCVTRFHVARTCMPGMSGPVGSPTRAPASASGHAKVRVCSSVRRFEAATSERETETETEREIERQLSCDRETESGRQREEPCSA